jgi:uncharacterized protein YciI
MLCKEFKAPAEAALAIGFGPKSGRKRRDRKQPEATEPVEKRSRLVAAGLALLLGFYGKLEPTRGGTRMKTSTGYIVVALALGIAAILAAQTQEANPLAPYIPKNMKTYYLILLVKGDKSREGLSQAENTALMQKHLAHLRTQVEAGKFLVVGPLLDDDRIRGMALAQAANAEEAAQMERGDALVDGGWLKTEVHPVLLQDLSSVKAEYPGQK